MTMSKKHFSKKLAPTVREVGTAKQIDTLFIKLRGLIQFIETFLGEQIFGTLSRQLNWSERIGKKVQPLVALMCSARTPTIGWRDWSLSSKVNQIFSSARREFSPLGVRAHG